MENELDLVVFEDGEGNELTMEVLDYFFYEGKEYAILSEYDESIADDEEREAIVMQVVPVGEDEEEFIPVDEALAEKLIEVVENGLYDDDELDEEE